ncbi:Integral membrane protein [Mycena sanguinolenta]|uniref:Integral membrane protein n=1 Tax=Mycena sanguinolenta TaxID=230812 RepID=A0A8H6YNJ1_9AGAR|nr:Integral membrane protein [Mycena sanguinolenta]
MTIFLFSKSDIVPILGPSLAVAMVLAGPTDIIAFILGFFWLELHLLTFEIKNQITGLEEDRLSKPNRPIVSGRLSVAAAQRLYLFVAGLSLVWSVFHGVLLCSAVYSFLGSIGYVCYCWGTTIIFDHGKPLSNISLAAVVISGLLHTTTGHAQDFRDRHGDAAIGRKTLPLLLPPRIARWSLAFLMATWTAFLIRLWAPPHAASILLSLLCLTSSVKFIRDHSVEADRDSYWYYNMWLITAHLLPVFARIAARRAVDPATFSF